MPPHVEVPQDSPAIDQRSRCQGSRFRDLWGVVSVDPEVGGMPVEGFMERANTPGRIWEHFMYRHLKARVEILQEGLAPLPRCDQCRMHMRAAKLFKKIQMDKCNKATERRIMWIYVDITSRCDEM